MHTAPPFAPRCSTVSHVAQTRWLVAPLPPSGLDTGDLVLFDRPCLKMGGFFGAAVCAAAKVMGSSPFDHIGVVVRNDEKGVATMKNTCRPETNTGREERGGGKSMSGRVGGGATGVRGSWVEGWNKGGVEGGRKEWRRTSALQNRLAELQAVLALRKADWRPYLWLRADVNALASSCVYKSMLVSAYALPTFHSSLRAAPPSPKSRLKANAACVAYADGHRPLSNKDTI